jgi:hypothetical protein
VNIERRCQMLQCAASVVGYSDGGEMEYSEQNMPQCVTCPPQIPGRLACVWSGPPGWVPETHRYGYIATLLNCSLLHWKRTITTCNCRRPQSALLSVYQHNANTNIKHFQFYFRLMRPIQYTCNSLLFQHIRFKISPKLIKTMVKTFVDYLTKVLAIVLINFREILKLICWNRRLLHVYEGGPKNNRNLNVERDTRSCCAMRR